MATAMTLSTNQLKDQSLSISERVITSSENEHQESRRRRAMQKGMSLWRYSLGVLFTMVIIIGLLWAVLPGYNWCWPRGSFGCMRRRFYLREQQQRMGGRLIMSSLENFANDQLLNIKMFDEQMYGLGMDYQPSSKFVDQRRMHGTNLYKILRTMPKGGLLHVHDFGMFRLDRLSSLIRSQDLWACIDDKGIIEEFRYSLQLPQYRNQDNYQCQWGLLKDLIPLNNSTFEHKLRKFFTISGHNFQNSTHMANHLRRVHRLIYGLISYKSEWQSFIQDMLEQLYMDGISYVELRSALPIIYDLKGTNYTIRDTVDSLQSLVEKFRTRHEDFIGVKLIYAPLRDSRDADLNRHLATATYLKAEFPDFVVGFDLISFGDECHKAALGSVPQLIHSRKQLDYYFHAGESLCPSSLNNTPGANLIDALLLGSRRIANPLNLPLHPEVLRVMGSQRIAAELCPLSNYYLQHVHDLSQHPAASLMATDFPFVLGSDYPLLWNAAPLTDDFYVMFAGIAKSHADLRLLKKLAMNSIQYSALSDYETKRALLQWHCRWNRWIQGFVGFSSITILA